MAVLPEHSYDRFVTVTYRFNTGVRHRSGEMIYEDRTRQHWMKQMPLPAGDTLTSGRHSAPEFQNPSRWRTRWLPGDENVWRVGDRFTVDGVLYRVFGVQLIGRREQVELYTED